MAFDLIKWDGGPITRPGIYDGVDMEAYHNRADLFGGEPHISSSGLRKIEDQDSNLEQFWLTYVMNLEREEPEDMGHYAFGRATHDLYLGEGQFKKQFVIRPETYPEGAIFPSEDGKPKAWSGNATWCRKWLEAARAQKKAVLNPEEFETIKGMAAKLGAHPNVQGGMLNGLVEKSIFWFREVVLEDGRVVRVWLKARPDVLPTDSLMVVDYKSTADASPQGCRRSITDFGYHQQLALIQEGVHVTTGLTTTEHVLLFQEKKAPFSINIKPLFPSAMTAGHLLNNRAIHRFAKAWADNEFGGYEDDEVPCDLMEWRVKQLQQEIKDGRLADDYKLPPRYVAPAAALAAPKLALAAPIEETEEAI